MPVVAPPCPLALRCTVHRDVVAALATGQLESLRGQLDLIETVARGVWRRQCRCALWPRVQAALRLA